VEPRTHYQISLTARQAVGVFVGLLLALGLSFFFGLMAGLSGRGREPTRVAALREPGGAAETLPPVETAVPTARAGASPASRPTPPGAAAEPTAPSTLQTFEDGGGEEALPPAPATAKPLVPPPAPNAAPAGKAPAPAGRVWVQVAAVSSRPEADGLTARLSKRGYRALVVTEKGRLRVRVGPYRTTEEARRAAERLRRQERIKSPWVVFEGK